MENENTEQTTADQEVPQPKKMSAKECVQQRLAGLVSGAIQPVKRGPGRPRGPNYGKGYQSRMDPNSPLSVARAEAGRKGQATIQSRVQKETWRKRNGRVLQAELDAELSALQEELKNYQYVENTLDREDTQEFVGICASVIEDAIWQRKWPEVKENFYDETYRHVSKEEQQYCSGWPESYIRDILISARYVLAPERTGLRNLAVKGLTHFLDWAKTRQKEQNVDDDFNKVVVLVRTSLPQVENGEIYRGPDYDDPRLTPPEPGRSIEEIWAERRRWETLGRDISSLPRIESESERALREDRERDTQMLIAKEEQVARAIEEQQRQQRQLLGAQYDEIQALLAGSSIFGSTPTRR